MAYIKVVERGKEGKYSDSESYHDLIHYCCLDSNKVVCNGCANIKSLDFAADEMAEVTRAAHKEFGKRISHTIIIFSPNELKHVSIDSLNRIAQRCMEYFSLRYQIVYGIHDKPVAHIHMVMNRVSFVDGKKYPDRYQDRQCFWTHVQDVLFDYDIRLWK